MTPELHQFLRELLIDAGQTDMPPELEEQMIKDLYTRLEDRLMLAALERLTEQQQEELERMAERKKSAEAVEIYLKQHIPDYDKFFAQVLEDFRALYVEASKDGEAEE